MAKPYINSRQQIIKYSYIKMVSVTAFFNSTSKNDLKLNRNISLKWSKIVLFTSSAMKNLNIRIRSTYLGYSIAREIYLFVYTLVFANILYFILNNEIQNKTDFCFAYVRKKDINMRIGKLHLYPFFFHYIINHYYHCG